MSDLVYLASQSARRQQLLGQLGVRFELLLPGPDEDAESLELERDGELPRDYVERVTRAKLAAARERRRLRSLPEAPILCSDTTVAIGRLAEDAAQAGAMLEALSGRTHRVLTAVAVSDGHDTHFAVSDSHVQFAPLPREVIDAYVASGEPFGKAGAYAIQSRIAGWIARIEGSHSGIMGLPLYETARLLTQARVRF